MNKRLGTYITKSTTGESFKAYIPSPLPPDPPLALTEEHFELLELANRELGRLDGLAALLPNISLFLYFYVRKEAVLSSQIEGTQSSLADLILYEHKEVPNVPLDDVQEVSSYVAALNHGLKRLNEGFPLSLRLLREIHGILLAKGRGKQKAPGEFRRSQNWIGGTRPGNAVFVPPPPEKVMECMGALEKFLHDDPVRTTSLIKAALAHVQFETIHPFLDGNGRLGRLLITLLFCTERVLNQPILYLSLYFKTHRTQYYKLLQHVREEGGWEEWLKFFLTGIHETAKQTVETTRNILDFFEKDKQKLATFGRASSSLLLVYQLLQRHPILSIQMAAHKLQLSIPTVTKTLNHLLDLKIVREMTGKERDRLFIYHRYVDKLSEGINAH